ncbi:MAG TPA: hypothetical protein VF116_15510 [Ktedonobacterales bacterium]
MQRIRSVLRLAELGAGLLSLVVGIATLQHVLFGQTAVPVVSGRSTPANLFELLLQSPSQLTFIFEAILAAFLVTFAAVAGCSLLHALSGRTAARVALCAVAGVTVILTATMRIWDGDTFLFPAAALALVAVLLSFTWSPPTLRRGVTTAAA